MPHAGAGNLRQIDRAGLEALFSVLADHGYRLIGPKIREDAIVYDSISGVGDLPEGWTDEHGPAFYRLRRRNDRALFGYIVGPQSWKAWLHPAREKLWSAEKQADGRIVVESDSNEPEKMAFIGVRGCDMAAIAGLDSVFLPPAVPHDGYRRRRENAFIIAVNCTEAGETCFCTSMGTGPSVSGAYDLVLTEMLSADENIFLVRPGSEAGERMMEAIPSVAADANTIAGAESAIDSARQRMGRTLDTAGIDQWLPAAHSHSRWAEVAKRCLTCGNCTMVCPTCFCSTVHDTSDLSGGHADRWQVWDSCFSLDFTMLGGAPVRASADSRYRHWITHKLATWQTQFDSSGCVGCGRCITWCPVGIDITEEAAQLRQGDPAPSRP